MEQDFKTNHVIDSVFLEKRSVMLFGEINDKLANDIIRKLWYLDWKDPGKDILLIINSPGGVTDSGFAMLDTIKLLQSKVTTLVTGLAASFGSVLSIAATSGVMLATPNARIMVHQPLIGGVVQAPVTDLLIHSKEIGKTKAQIAELYSEVTGKSVEEVLKQLFTRDTWLSPQEALDYGLLTGIVKSHEEIASHMP